MAIKLGKSVYNKDTNTVTIDVVVPVALDFIKIDLDIKDFNKESNMMGKALNSCHCKSPKPLTSEADGNPFIVCAKSKGGCGKEIEQNNYGKKDIAPLASYDEGRALTVEEIDEILMGWSGSLEDLEKIATENIANLGPCPDLDLLFPVKNGVSKSALDTSKYCNKCKGFGRIHSKIYDSITYCCPDCNGSGMASA